MKGSPKIDEARTYGHSHSPIVPFDLVFPFAFLNLAAILQGQLYVVNRKMPLLHSVGKVIVKKSLTALPRIQIAPMNAS